MQARRVVVIFSMILIRKFVHFLLIKHLIPVLEGYLAKKKIKSKTPKLSKKAFIQGITVFLIIKALLVKEKIPLLTFFIEPASSDLAG